MDSPSKNNQEHFNYKIIILGDPGVGKTSLALRYTDRSFSESTKCTIGVDFKTKYITIDDLRVRINIFDTAGQESYLSVVKTYYNNTDAVILAYSITSKESFARVEYWLSEFLNNCNSSVQPIKILVGMKSDREEDRQVSKQDAKQLMQRKNFLFSFETSSKTDDRVNQVFEEICRNLLVRTFKTRKNSGVGVSGSGGKGSGDSINEGAKSELMQMMKQKESKRQDHCC